MENENAFKHRVNEDLVRRLASATKAAWPLFDSKGFLRAVVAELEPLELKARIDFVTKQWAARLPSSYGEALPVVLATMGPPLTNDTDVSQSAFYHWLHAHFVQCFGLEHPQLSLSAMVEITQRSTAEFCVRPFFERYPRETLAFLKRLRTHASPHVRRWVSEGSRPRLPWGLRLQAFIKDPTPVLGLITPLRADPSLYVRNSVANNLNDIAKDHPDIVVETMRSWLSETKNTHAPWLAKRALRHLVKQGHAGALQTLGFGAGTQAKLVALRLERPRVRVGDHIEFEVLLRGRAPEKVNVDYAVTYQLAAGKTGQKVFKLKVLDLKQGQTVLLRKRHSLKPITTRRYYAGEHSITILANGQSLGSLKFDLALR
ncbi:MAG: DNA alkylation repair protein [Deltaproteobacteria bacterium]|nr:DNA alkylation repair protein [Deltaproteobacteria bacterium]